MDVLDKLASIFMKKKEFIEIEKIELDNSKVYETVDEDLFIEFEEEVDKLIDREGCELPKMKLYSKNSMIFLDKNELLNRVRKDLLEEYHINIEESKTEGWKATYFVSKNNVYEDTIEVTIGLEYPKEFNMGNVYYSLVVCKYQNQFYYWGFD